MNSGFVVFAKKNIPSVSFALLAAMLTVTSAFGGDPRNFRLPPAPSVMVQQAPFRYTPPVNQPAQPAATSQPAAADESPIVVQQSQPIVAKAHQWQSWNQYITLTKGQDLQTLTLSLENGIGGSRFNDLRINLAGRPLASIKDFKGQSVLTMNMTGSLGVGDTLLQIQGLGESGARFSWKVTTLPVIVSDVTPTTVSMAEKITVTGKNFSERPNVTQVNVGGKPATLLSVKSTSLLLTLPSGVSNGKVDLIVTVGTLKSKAFKITVKSQPEVTSVDFVSTAPGQPVTISGKNFSAVASENQVSFGGTAAARIVSASTSSITCVVPEMAQNPIWDVPIKVTTNGVESKGNVKINIQLRVIPNEGLPQL